MKRIGISEFNLQLMRLFSFRKRIFLLLWLLIVPIIVVFADGLTARIEFTICDFWERAICNFRPVHPDIVIAAIDTETLKFVPDRWPWPREHYAKIQSKLQNSGAKFILWDILFQHPQPHGSGNGDEVFTKAIAAAGNVVLVSLIENKVFPSGIQKIYLQNHDSFRNAARYQGLVRANMDPDGISRSFILQDRDFGIKSSALWIAEQMGQEIPVLLPDNENVDNFLIAHACRGGEIPQISCSKILSGNFSADEFKNKIVIIGNTAPILHDYHNSSRGLMSGPRLLAISIDTLLMGRGAEILRGYYWRIPAAFLAFFISLIAFAIMSDKPVRMFVSVTFAASLIWLAFKELVKFFLPLGSFLLVSWLIMGSIIAVKSLMDALDQQQLEAEASAAGRVQAQLFPDKPLETDTHKIFGTCIPCTTAGGDFYEMFTLPCGKSFFAIADVMGHGIPAAMVTSMIKAILSQHRHQTDFSLTGCVSQLNQVISGEFKRRKMTTGIFGLYDPATGNCELAVAGHPFPYLCRQDGSISEVRLSSLPLGIAQKPKIGTTTLVLAPGDTLVFYTDGIIEALDWSEEPYGYDRWQKNLETIFFSNEDLPDVSVLFEDMRVHTQGRKVDDDLTILLLRVKKAQPDC
jgi:CHASE2 domain-containing sensor protein